MKDTEFKNIKDLVKGHVIFPGTSMCAGCGGLETIRLFADLLGNNTVFVNAAGCMTLLTIYPFSPFKASWLYTAMASAPAGAQGIRDALDILIDKGELQVKDNLRVVVITGDGSAYGMGLSSTSAAMDRKLDFFYLCYDNEGYGNTGQQDSAATPRGARTSTSATGDGYIGSKKDLFTIWTSHRPSYAATVIASEPLDLARKVEKAINIAGPKMFITLAPCPTGWHFDPCKTIEIGKLAVNTGYWPLKEYFNEEVIHTKIIKNRLPVEEYLRPQGRFSHLFYPERNGKVISELQFYVDQYWSNLSCN